MNKKPTSLKEGLRNKIPEEFLLKINRSFEIVGNIAICEISEELFQYESTIAQTLLEINSHITTVVKKDGFHGGVFRTQKMKVIGGVDTKIATYKENDVTLQLNVEEVYFSTKLSTERENLAKNVHNTTGNILVLFSGSGPYTYVITRKNPDISAITSCEINPQGHEYAIKNLELNKNNLKKSSVFKELLSVCKSANLKVYDKEIISHLNSLVYQFYNIDAKQFLPKLRECSDDYTTSSIDFDTPFYTLYHELQKNSKSIFELNLDELSFENKKVALYLVILFSNMFSYVIIINSKQYLISTLHEKNYLFQLLQDKQYSEITKYDEIYMPLPKDAELFLDVAFMNSKKNCVVHMYDFVHENEFPHKSEQAVKEFATRNGFDVEIIEIRKVGQYSPRKYRVCCDFKIL